MTKKIKKLKQKPTEFKTNRIPQCQYIGGKSIEWVGPIKKEILNTQCREEGNFPVNGYNMCFTHKNMFEHTPSKYFEFVMRIEK